MNNLIAFAAFVAFPLVLTAPIILTAIFMISERGSFLFLLSKKDKEKYDDKTLFRFIGKVVLPMSLSIPLSGLILFINRFFSVGYINITALMSGNILLVIGFIVFALIYVNTGNRFRKQS